MLYFLHEKFPLRYKVDEAHPDANDDNRKPYCIDGGIGRTEIFVIGGPAVEECQQKDGTTKSQDCCYYGYRCVHFIIHDISPLRYKVDETCHTAGEENGNCYCIDGGIGGREMSVVLDPVTEEYW